MRSFEKMIRDKRVKVLTFVLLLLVLHAITSTDSLDVPDLMHLVRSGGESDTDFCVAFDEEAYSAIEWSYPIPEDESELPKTVSTYFPSPISSYGCDFEEDRECNKIWNLRNWTRPVHTPRNYIPILDTRWEDFRTYLFANKTKMGDNRIEIPQDANIGISVRCGGTVNILLCEGFNPETYPCYTITLGGGTEKTVSVAKYGEKDNIFQNSSQFPILSVDEWKNFNLFLSKTGEIHLQDVNKEIVHISTVDRRPLNILYLFLNSSSPSLWKVHMNYFLYTNVSQYTEFGPPINITSSTLCLSMYLMMCEDCSIYLYKRVDISKEIIFELDAKAKRKIHYEWTHIRIIVENVTESSMQLFIKTNSNATNRFWSIDNVRVCVKDEFKMRNFSKSEFSKKADVRNPTFSCHSLEFPEWRPKPQVIPNAGLPIVTHSSNTTSIQLHWKSYPQPYIINYKGSDICDKNTVSRFKNVKRLKSNGWIIVKSKENTAVLKNLVPYTHYDVAFIDPVYGINKTLSISTIATDKPTKDEIPVVTVVPKVNSAVIKFSSRNCNASYGPIIYRIGISQRSDPLILVEGDVYTWKNLEPYTNYTLTVEIARTISALNRVAVGMLKFYNFTTKPDVAPPLILSELYEIGETLASFRYKLPAKSHGVPTLIQVRYWNALLPKYIAYISNVTRCDLWKDLYCVTVPNLMKQMDYKFMLSVKNNDTNAFSDEVSVSKKTADTFPGKPTNLSYNVINCSKEGEFCNLNISWSHPYDQRGVITYFRIVWKELNTLMEEEDTFIAELVPVHNRRYLPVYWHVVEEFPYAKTYYMSVQAGNDKYRGLLDSTVVKIDHIGQHIDQTPKFLRADAKSVTFQVPKLDSRLKSSIVTVVVQRNDSQYANVPRNLKSLAGDTLCLDNRTSWITGAWELSHEEAINITIGHNDKIFVKVLNDTVVNRPLQTNNEYCINFLMNNTYKDIDHVMVYHKNHIVLSGDPQAHEEEEPKRLSVGSIIVLILLVMLLIGVTTFGIVFYRRNQRRRRIASDGDHIYEAMPNDEPSEVYNVVYNAVYDKLSHE